MIFIFLYFFFLSVNAWGADSPPQLYHGPHFAKAEYAVLQGVDKVTGRRFELTVKIGQEVVIGTLRVTPRVCYKAAAQKKMDHIAYLTCYDAQKEKPLNHVFSGWMFSASPGLSALEHPVFDVWIKECTNGASHSGE